MTISACSYYTFAVAEMGGSFIFLHYGIHADMTAVTEPVSIGGVNSEVKYTQRYNTDEEGQDPSYR